LARKSPNPRPRKRRTRQHVIAELGVNHVERHVLLGGHVLERVRHDYGLELVLYTFDRSGEAENGEVYFQVKATESLRLTADRKTIAWRLAQADLRHWLHEPMPVFLIVYDAATDRALWLYVQAYFEGQHRLDLSGIGATVTVHIPVQNAFDETALPELARCRDLVLEQMKGVIRHHE
jgi:hypothetical protein